MDPFDRFEALDSFRHIDDLLACGIFSPQNARSPLFRSAFIDVLICLRDLMYKTEKYVSRVNFVDDITISGSVTDATSLIKYVRDAMCHLDSDNHYLEAGNIKASFNVLFGQGTGFVLNAIEHSSPYPDDVCFFFGSQQYSSTVTFVARSKSLAGSSHHVCRPNP